ncbi:cache domain-containing protein [Pendulispora brunnea]|uniref:Cache domain-containing protein n=1 Tax=Pendulispora brunnea TaxID=2905690 RepID=A0ABZ2JZ97_9BACT
MRTKIIAVNAVIVLLVGLLTFVLVRKALDSAAGNPTQLMVEAKRDAQAASARLQLDGLRMERWLAGKASEPATLEVLAKASPVARGDAATNLCDAILSAAKQSPVFAGAVPSLVVLIDAQGKSIGRNGTNIGRGEDYAAAYEGLKTALANGQSGSDAWAKAERNDQYLASYAPVRDAQGRVVGAIAAGFTLNDELSRVSDATTGRALRLVTPQGNALQIAAAAAGGENINTAINGDAKDTVKNALTAGRVGAQMVSDTIIAAAVLEGFGDGKRAVVVSARPASLIENVNGLILPGIFGVTLLGLVLVVVGGWLLGNYITQPIAVLEEGLLAILNGQADKRFQLDHPDLGGLAFRIDQLLNQLMGIEEDTTDEEGRVSKAPTASNFNDAMSVDERQLDAGALQQLASEPAEQYYARIYREYIAAKRQLGEAVDHITDQTFRQRIQGMEQEASQKYGKPVRYRVQLRGREVTLLAIPLG